MTARRHGALLFTGLLLFAAGLVVGYAIRGAQPAPGHAGDAAQAPGPDGSVAIASAPHGDAGVEPPVRRSGDSRAASDSDLPGTGGAGAPPETIGAERDPARAPSTPAAAESASSEQTAPDDGGVRPRGRLDRNAIREVVRDHRDQLGFCFAWQLHQNPGLHGRITMDFTIGEDGRVTRAEVLDDQLGDETVLRCFRSVTTRMRFPPPEGGEVSVHYPFELSPEEASE